MAKLVFFKLKFNTRENSTPAARMDIGLQSSCFDVATYRQ